MKLRKKMKKQNGFTLIEMLIVVAIIAILVAVSIPVVNTALERTKRATDAANERAAKAEIMVRYLSGAEGDDEIQLGTAYHYDANTGKILSAAETPKGYGKCNKHKDGYIKVTLSKAEGDEGAVTVKWVVGSDSVDAHDGNVDKDPTT